jgi:Ca2+-transporting ATPase
MRSPPRDPSRPVIDGRMWRDIAFIGLVMAVGTLFVIDAALPGGLVPGSGSLAYAQTMAFTVLVFFQLFNVFNARSDQRSAFHNLSGNRWVWVAVLLSALLQIAVIYAPFLQQAFGTVPLNGRDWLICLGVSSTVLWIDEGMKCLRRCKRLTWLGRSPGIGTI